MRKLGLMIIGVIAMLVFVNAAEARWYSPQMKRFISEDPMGYAAGDMNFYRYVKNSPLNFVDPLGLTSWPTNYCRVNRGYTTDITFTGRPHRALDIRNWESSPAYATDAGTIIEIGYDEESGNYIKIRLADGDEVSYSHTSTDLDEGDCVTEGQRIGTSDGSGAGPPHLHFVFYRCTDEGCSRIDPTNYLTGATMVGTSSVCAP